MTRFVGFFLLIALLLGTAGFVAARIPGSRGYSTAQVDGTRIEFGLSPNDGQCTPSITFKPPWQNTGFFMTLEGDFGICYDNKAVGQWTFGPLRPGGGYFGDLVVQDNDGALDGVWRFSDQAGNVFIRLDGRLNIVSKAAWTEAWPAVDMPTTAGAPHVLRQILGTPHRLTGGGTAQNMEGISGRFWGAPITSDTPGTQVRQASTFMVEAPFAADGNTTLLQSCRWSGFPDDGSCWTAQGVFLDSDSAAARAQKDPLFKAQFLRLLQDDAAFKAQVKTLLGIP